MTPASIFGETLTNWFEPDRWDKIDFGTRASFRNNPPNAYANRTFVAGLDGVDGAGTLTQATVAYQPRMLFGAHPTSGRNTIRFEDSTTIFNHLVFGTPLAFAGDFTVVLGFSGYKGGRYILGAASGTARLGLFTGQTQIRLSNAGATDTTLAMPTSGYNWLWLRRRAGLVEAAFNDADWTPLFAGAQNTETTDWSRLGGDNTATRAWEGEMFALASASRAVTNGERTRLTRDWLSGWNTAPALAKNLRRYFPAPALIGSPTIWTPTAIDNQRTFDADEDFEVVLSKEAVTTFPIGITGGRTMQMIGGYMRPTSRLGGINYRCIIPMRGRFGDTYIEGLALSMADCPVQADFTNIDYDISLENVYPRPALYMQNVWTEGFFGKQDEHHSDQAQQRDPLGGRMFFDNCHFDTNYQGLIMVPHSGVGDELSITNGPQFVRRTTIQENNIGGVDENPSTDARLLFMHNFEVNSGNTYLNTFFPIAAQVGAYINGDPAKKAVWGPEYERNLRPGTLDGSVGSTVAAVFVNTDGGDATIGYAHWPNAPVNRSYEFLSGRVYTGVAPEWITLADIWDGSAVAYQSQPLLYA